MEDIVFRHDRQHGPEKFILQDTCLVIIGGVGLDKERFIKLTDIAPTYEKGERRFSAFYFVPLFLASLTGVVTWGLAEQGVPIVPIITGVLAIAFLFFMKFAPVEVARFRDKRGEFLFELYRPQKAAYTYDEFVSALVSRIEGT